MQDDKCSDCAPLLLSQTNELYNEKFKLHYSGKGDSVKIVQEILKICDLLHSVEVVLINEPGGIDPKTSCLMSPCTGGEAATRIFTQLRLVKKIEDGIKSIHSLKEVQPKEKKELADNCIDFLNYIILSKSSYMNERSVREKPYAQTALELGVIENAMYAYIVKNENGVDVSRK